MNAHDDTNVTAGAGDTVAMPPVAMPTVAMPTADGLADTVVVSRPTDHEPGPATAGDADAERGTIAVLTAAAAGAGVFVSLGVYARLHVPTGEAITTFGFGSVLQMKVWLTTIAAALALAQAATAAWMWERLPGVPSPAPPAVAVVHRWTGTVAFVVTLPVAYHCLWSLGLQYTDTRVLVHGLLGCAFYGAFATKMLLLRSRWLPPMAMPVAGGTLVVLLTCLWLTSSLWFFMNAS